MSPKYRSLLKSINLVALVKKKWIKQYSMNAILDPIVKDIKKLVSFHVRLCTNRSYYYYIVFWALKYDSVFACMSAYPGDYCLRVYRSCYVDSIKCGAWVLTQEWELAQYTLR